jgi:type II secretory pathway component PulF
VEASLPEPSHVSLDDLLALNAEIAALGRAGVPIEEGLLALSGDMPGRLGRLASQIGIRASRGEPLERIVADQALRLPPVYRAIVEAGIKSGRLSTALESLAGSLRRLSEARRGILAASLYPLIECSLVCFAFALFCMYLAPLLGERFDALKAPYVGWFHVLVWLGRFGWYWGLGVPALILGFAGFWAYESRRAIVAEPRFGRRLMGWMPWVGAMLRDSQQATFAEIAGLLVEHSLPLHEAIRLAADAAGDANLWAAAWAFAEASRRGEPIVKAAAAQPQLPPSLRWLILTARDQAALSASLRHVAARLQRRAQDEAERARVFLPVLMLVGLGGVVTACYVLSLFVPYTTLLRALS